MSVIPYLFSWHTLYTNSKLPSVQQVSECPAKEVCYYYSFLYCFKIRDIWETLHRSADYFLKLFIIGLAKEQTPANKKSKQWKLCQFVYKAGNKKAPQTCARLSQIAFMQGKKCRKCRKKRGDERRQLKRRHLKLMEMLRSSATFGFLQLFFFFF